MKSLLKKSIIAGLLLVSCSTTALAAPTVDSLTRDIGDLGTFYTLYAGMPISDYHENWDGISGWQRMTKNYDNKTPHVWLDTYRRSYKINNKQVKETVSVQTYEKYNSVRNFDWKIESYDRRVIEDIFLNIYDRLASEHPEITERIPKAYTNVNNKKPWCYIENKTVAFGMYLGEMRENNTGRMVYFISLGYESQVF